MTWFKSGRAGSTVTKGHPNLSISAVIISTNRTSLKYSRENLGQRVGRFVGVCGVSSLDHHYFAERERECRKMAAEADDPAVKAAHLQLAQFYANRAQPRPAESRESSEDAQPD